MKTAFLYLAVCALSAVASTCTSAQFVEINPVPASVRSRITVTNALIGAALGGARAWIAHRSVTRGIALGATGGLVTSAGRQIVATRGLAAGVSGRLLHGVGLGIGSAAKDSVLTIPIHVGPLVARWTPTKRRLPTIRVNLTNLVVSTVALVHADGRIDWRATLWSGAFTVLPPFRGSGFNLDLRARAGPGTIYLSPASPFCARRDDGEPICRLDLAHEGIHVLQLDMMHEWIGKDIEHAALHRIRGGKALGRYVEIGAVGPATALLLDATRPYEKRWTEYEAFWLTEGLGPPKP